MLTLRHAIEDDCRILWDWANDPTVRAVSFSSESIPWERHVKWFLSKLEDPHYLFYIAVDNEGTPIGQARFNIVNEEVLISVSIAIEFRGKGYGSDIIQIASDRIFDVSSVGMIHAYIKQTNEASLKAFSRAGFQEAGTTQIHGCPAVHFILKKDV